MEDEILLKYIEGAATDAEVQQVVEWLDASEEHMQEYLLLRKAYDVSIWGDSESHVTISNKKTKRIRIYKEFLKVAAMLLLVVGAYHIFYEKWGSQGSDVTNQTMFAPEGQRAELTLSDGTKVWLNAKSTLEFPSTFAGKERTVKLTGEAYFDVKHDAQKQFIVETDKYKVKVLGTEFNVRAYPDINLFETSLIRGSVEIVSVDEKEKVLLKPNDKVCLNDGMLVKNKLKDFDTFLWKDGILTFEDMAFEDILRKLELYYDVDITIKNPSVLHDRYTGKFWIKDGVEQVLKVLQRYNKFSYTKDEMNQIVIK